jgi:hypothetical protein
VSKFKLCFVVRILNILSIHRYRDISKKVESNHFFATNILKRVCKGRKKDMPRKKLQPAAIRVDLAVFHPLLIFDVVILLLHGKLDHPEGKVTFGGRLNEPGGNIGTSHKGAIILSREGSTKQEMTPNSCRFVGVFCRDPPSSTPVIAGLQDAKLHPRKGSINLSSLAGFDPMPLALANGRVCAT